MDGRLAVGRLLTTVWGQIPSKGTHFTESAHEGVRRVENPWDLILAPLLKALGKLFELVCASLPSSVKWE